MTKQERSRRIPPEAGCACWDNILRNSLTHYSPMLLFCNPLKTSENGQSDTKGLTIYVARKMVRMLGNAIHEINTCDNVLVVSDSLELSLKNLKVF